MEASGSGRKREEKKGEMARRKYRRHQEKQRENKELKCLLETERKGVQPCRLNHNRNVIAFVDRSIVMKPSVFILNIYSTMRTDYNQQPVLVLLLWSSSLSDVGLTHLFRNHWNAVGPECTVKWELKLVVTNPNNKH
ncbi:hypothetical protein DVH24_010292 [Malus domestica]|uniref:Uncharacterized protein n=1 Tax=Malus domestica TaxID=3750 RepID=A0A498JSP4_MALDO|nr:hypothetical protein DVH24_010292 [Malus domestica]